MDNKILNKSVTVREIIFFAFLLLCLMPFISSPVALLMGIVVAQSIGHPFLHLNHKATHILLQFSVVGLGFGMNVDSALQAGKSGFTFTILSILTTLVMGYLLGRLLKVDRKSSFLITVGTAICGGSAIAAISPVIKAQEKQISVALGTIFILNAVALFIFPLIGQSLQLSQQQFGIWSAIAIQDTSSVVGAASKYGAEALQIATTVKLTRALWIIPIAVLSSLLFRNKGAKIKIPYFIGLFVMAIVLNTYLPFVKIIGSQIVQLSKVGLTLTLFLIGSGLSREVFTSVGFKPILQGLVLWILISAPALLAVLYLLG
ncbi:putative sulfate exporter family transporter [Pedobacter sp. KBW01]|uniref:YeiH family protein n=1 Tax=Pedobacter sp. KBW01 TaxID=2153364 RepID=UPI000F59B48D|nr:putative sulfate exporter family transporter [Pedobacter sp. KBW01]RQO73539.1 putative sulfate exporter family transporter [Pedobacter sp. KBW01]